MLTESQTRWTDDRIQALVTPPFILEQFNSQKRPLLKQSISRRDAPPGLSYLDCILERAKRFFLILQHIGIPDHIFRVLDDSYQDDDLPIPIEAVKHLRLPAGQDSSVERKFYRAQFIYLVRDIKEGDHKRFLDDEIIPVRSASSSAIGRSGKGQIEKVHLLPNLSKAYGQKKLGLDESSNHLSEDDVLAEIAAARQLANEHVLSVYASYSHKNQLHVLLRPHAEMTLNSFLDSPPRHFEHLSKPQRREILINWPHCLAHGLAWLHSNGRSHGAIRPTNILIDSDYRIYLGQVEGLAMTQGHYKVSDLESYQYAAPERWQRAATMQRKAPASLTLHSGGRTARKHSMHRPTPPGSVYENHEDASSNSGPMSSDFPLDSAKPTFTGYNFLPTSRGNAPRLGHRRTGSSEYSASVVSSSSNDGGSRRADSMRILPGHSTNVSGSKQGPSANISSHSLHGGQKAKPTSVTLAPSEVRTTVVQTWQSAQFDQRAADVFSFGAVAVDIINFFSKRSSSAFAKHRAAKNRTGGRGGGVLDASFHANLGQVCSWTVSLEEDANKKASKEGLKIFEAVGPSLELARECLARSPDERPSILSVEKALERCIQECTAYAMAHCQLRPPTRRGVRTPFQKSAGADTGIVTKADQTARPISPQGLGLGNSGLHGAQQASRPNSSLGRFDFGYHNNEAVSHQQPMTRGGLSEEEIISLQSIADRPDELENGLDTSHWRHKQVDFRDGSAASKSGSPSVSQEEEAERRQSRFRPAESQSSIGAKGQSQLQSLHNSSRQSLNQSYPSNTAAKRVSPNVNRSRGKGSGLDPDGHDPDGQRGDIIEMGEMGDGATARSGKASANQRYGMVDPDYLPHQRDAGKPGRPGDTDLDATEISRGRNSVSTLASNSSTIRLSWQHRDVSPVSIHDADGSGKSSMPANPSGDRKVDTSGSRSRQPSEAQGQNGDSKKRVGLARVERVYRNLQRNEVVIKGPVSGGDKGKKKEESTSHVKKGGLVSRYSILGGRM